jgi:exopolysaccharide production protein ExoZ
MKRLAALEGLRGYAAFLVFLVHSCGLVIARAHGVDPDHVRIREASPGVAVLLFLFRSHYGVDLFFVLSGLLMADIAARRWPGARTFLARRALRIYPAYLASLAIVAVATSMVFEKDVIAGEVAGNLAFLQGFFVLGIPALNPPTWSLSYEAAFYLCVPLLALAAGRLPGWSFPVTFLGLIALFGALPGGKTLYFAYFALFVPGLWLGSMDAEARERYAKRLPAWMALGAWAAFALAFKLQLIANTSPAYYVASGIACGLLVLKLCDGSSPLARWLSSPPALALGHISYSFFLIHFVVLHVLGHWLIDSGMAPGAAFTATILVGGFAASALAAWALYAVAERFYFTRRRR